MMHTDTDLTPPARIPAFDRLEFENRLLLFLTRAIADAGDLNTALRLVLWTGCEVLGWPCGQAWLPDPANEAMECAPVWHSRDADFLPIRQASVGQRFQRDEGLIGAVWTARRHIWVPDLALDARFLRADAARVCGIRSVVVVPVLAGSDVMGVLEFFASPHVEQVEEDDRSIKVLATVAGQLGSLLQRKQAEESLRRSEARYRSLIQGAPFGFCRTTVDGRFLDANAALVEMLGYGSAAELLAAGTRDLYCDEAERDIQLRHAQDALAQGLQVRWKRRDGTAIIVRLKGRAVMNDQTGRVEFEAIVENVTELCALEQQLRLAQKMEAVGRLAGGVAHDFNNVLMAISGYAELLLNDLDHDDRRREDVDEIRKAADRAASLTRQLLAFSRRQPVASKTVDLNALVGNMDRMLRRLVGEDVQLRTLLAPEPLYIHADPGQIEQVVMNLVVNARDAMPGGGAVTIETAAMDLSPADARRHVDLEAGPHVMLSVSDTGCGITPEVQSRLFEPFFTTKEPGKGTGLGLSTVYAIVNRAGGTIRAESEAERGATFRICLPRMPAPGAVADVGSARDEVGGGSGTILLVEDEDAVRALVKEVLSRAGYTILEAGNGQEALALARRHEGPINLMLTDVVMPKMNGGDLARALARLRPEMRVLFMSGYTDPAVIRRGAGVLDEGAEFLQKPFIADGLVRKVRKMLG